MNEVIARLPRVWYGFELPGYRAVSGTYGGFELANLPPVEVDLDDEFTWLRTQDELLHSLATPSGDAQTPLDPDRLRELLGRHPNVRPPRSFELFTRDVSLRSRIRSPTACYLELAESVVTVPGGGVLIHFLSDQQSVLHWLLYTEEDGAEAVVCSAMHYGFPEWAGEGEPDLSRLPPEDRYSVVCASSFAEFTFRLWIEGEIFFRCMKGSSARTPLSELQRRYAEHLRADEGGG